MKKILIVTTVSGFVPQFEMNNVRMLIEDGYEVHYASNFNMPVYGSNERLDGTGIIRHQIDFVRSPFRLFSTIKAYRQLKALVEKEKITVVHCHTPVGGALARLVCKNLYRHNESTIIYTAHGFHFFKGAPWYNWLLYYPVERYLAHFTDILITMNDEDYRRTQKFHLKKGGLVAKINGVGIKIEEQKEEASREASVMFKRKELGIKKEAFLLVSVGEITKRKNHEIIIKAISQMPNPDLLYIICGEGKRRNKLEKMVSTLGIESKVRFLGYRTDVKEILKESDCFVFPSKQEGLPVALLEGMRSEIPIICSRIRGNVDLMGDNKGAEVIDVNDLEGYKRAIKKIYDCKKNNDVQQLKKKQEYNRMHIKEFSEEMVKQQMRGIYERIKE